MTVEALVRGKPVGKERPRVSRHGPYTPRRTAEYEERVAWEVKARNPGLRPDRDHHWRLAVTFVLGDRRGRDLDNLIKTVMDALEGVVWVNDHQVVTIQAAKRYVKDQWYAQITAWEDD